MYVASVASELDDSDLVRRRDQGLGARGKEVGFGVRVKVRVRVRVRVR